METSKVYFTNLRTTPSSNLLDKMERLVKRAGIANIDFQNQFVAIKIHFGEPGNLAFIRPNYAARMATLLRNLGAKPFLTDCNTLYSGRRANAVDHLESAMENGFNPISAKCDVIIADGLKKEPNTVKSKSTVNIVKLPKSVPLLPMQISLFL